MPSRRDGPEKASPTPADHDAEVERLSDELKQQVRRAKERISERLQQTRPARRP